MLAARGPHPGRALEKAGRAVPTGGPHRALRKCIRFSLIERLLCAVGPHLLGALRMQPARPARATLGSSDFRWRDKGNEKESPPVISGVLTLKRNGRIVIG